MTIIDQMSLAHYLFNDSFDILSALDRLFDDVFHPRALLRVQDSDSFKPRLVPKFQPLTVTHRMDVHCDKTRITST